MGERNKTVKKRERNKTPKRFVSFYAIIRFIFGFYDNLFWGIVFFLILTLIL